MCFGFNSESHAWYHHGANLSDVRIAYRWVER
jgi:hypothetical protein